MSLTITRVETKPDRGSFTRGEDGRELVKSTLVTAGTFVNPYGAMVFDKYFITNHTSKKREDFVVIRTHEVPPLEETFARLNRAAIIGKQAVRRSRVYFGAHVSKEYIAEINGEGDDTEILEYEVELPLAVNELAETREMNVREDGEGLFWFRLYNRRFTVYADNPAMQDHPVIGVFIPTETPNTANTDLNHLRWQYADALLTPSQAELPGALGDMSVRAALIGLKPGITSV